MAGLKNLKSIFYGGAGTNLSQIQDRHGKPLESHIEDHSLFDDFQHRPGYGPGLSSDTSLGPSALENMVDGELSPFLASAFVGQGEYPDGNPQSRSFPPSI